MPSQEVTQRNRPTLDKPQAQCKGCGASIEWRPFPTTGKMHPFNPDGTSHFGTCPRAADFRRKKR